MTKDTSMRHLVNQLETLFTTGTLAAGFLPGLAVILLMILFAVMIARRNRKHLNTAYDLHTSASL